MIKLSLIILLMSDIITFFWSNWVTIDRTLLNCFWEALLLRLSSNLLSVAETLTRVTANGSSVRLTTTYVGGLTKTALLLLISDVHSVVYKTIAMRISALVRKPYILMCNRYTHLPLCSNVNTSYYLKSKCKYICCEKNQVFVSLFGLRRDGTICFVDLSTVLVLVQVANI